MKEWIMERLSLVRISMMAYYLWSIQLLIAEYDQAIAYALQEWQLSDFQVIVYPCVFNNYLAICYSEIYQSQVVLKISQSNYECYALQALQGDGIVKLLDYNLEHCALLLEYLPAQNTFKDFLVEHGEDQAIDVFVDLFKKIHAYQRSVQSNEFTTVFDTFSFLYSCNSIKIPESLLKKSIEIYKQLMVSSDSYCLLHGDLHCINILQTNDHFVAIDPWGLVGPLECEAASFLSSPTDLLLEGSTDKILQNRLDRLSSLLNLNKKRLKYWSFLRLIRLAYVCEFMNKHDDWIEQFIQVAQIIDQLNEYEQIEA